MLLIMIIGSLLILGIFILFIPVLYLNITEETKKSKINAEATKAQRIKNEHKKNEAELIADLKMKYDNSAFLNEVFTQIEEYYNFRQIMYIHILSSEIICELYDGIRDNNLISKQVKIKFEKLGYDRIPNYYAMKAFTFALQFKLGEDYIQHFSEASYSCSIEYKFNDYFKPVLRLKKTLE